MFGIKLNTFILVIASFLLVCVAFFSLHQYFISPSFNELEDERTQADLSRILSNFSLEVQSLESLASILSTESDPKILASESQFFNITKINFMYLLDNDRKITFKRSQNSDGKGSLALPELDISPWPKEQALLERMMINGQKSGFFLTKNGPIIFASHVLLDQQQQVSGSVIIGKVLDTVFLENLSALSNIEIAILPKFGTTNRYDYEKIITRIYGSTENLVSDKDSDFIYLYSAMPSVDEKNDIIISIKSYREISAFGKKASLKIFAGLIAINALFGLYMFLLIRKRACVK